MIIDVLSPSTVKITLSRADMSDYELHYESLSGRNAETRRMLTRILRSVYSEKKIRLDSSGDRLFIEAFPRPDGGCMLYISAIPSESEAPIQEGRRRRKSREQCLICSVSGIDALRGIIRALSFSKNRSSLGKKPLKSSVYQREDGFCVALSGELDDEARDAVKRISTEFMAQLETLPDAPLELFENCRLLSGENAVEVLSRVL